MLWLCAATVAVAAFPANNQYDANRWSARLRSDILSQPDYDRLVPPTSNRSLTAGDLGHYSDSGTDVRVQIRFFKVESIQAAEGSMKLKVWVRYKWKDERLVWNPASYGGLTETFYLGESFAGDENSEIWLPDVQPYNVHQGLVHTLEPSMATVQSDGTVFWSRPGSLYVMCKFAGLSNFPFDTLKCQLEVGGWALSGGQQGIELHNGGYAFSSQETTSGSSYQEMVISNVSVELRNYVYPDYPSEPWPVILYTVSLKRSSMFYAVAMILPGIVTTFLSFMVFFTDSNSSDALGYGIGAIIVNVLFITILMGILPACNELTWMHLFSILNTVFCCLSLFQSTFIIMVEQMEDDHLLPLWIFLPASHAYEWLVRNGRSLRKRWHGRVDPNDPGHRVGPTSSTEKLSAAMLIRESVAGFLFRQEPGVMKADASVSAVGSRSRCAREQDDSLSEGDRAKKLIFFERLFFRIDADCNLHVDVDEFDLLLSYAALDLDPLARRRIFDKYDFFADGKLSRVEFVTMCMEVLWHVPQELLQMAMENLEIARKAHLTRNIKYWAKVSKQLDSYARVLIPTAYVLSLILLFHLELADNYYANEEAPMFRGIYEASLNTKGQAFIATFCVLVLVVGIAWVRARHVAARNAKRVQRELTALTRQSLESFVSSHRQATASPTPLAEASTASPTEAFRAPSGAGRSRTGIEEPSTP